MRQHTFRFPVNRHNQSHQLTLYTIDEGQIVQRVMIDWGGLRESYVEPVSGRLQ